MIGIRRTIQAAAIGVVLAVALLFTSVGGCVGAQARNGVLAPAMLTAWTAISVQATAGGATSEQVADFDAALRAKDNKEIVKQWPSIMAAAEVRISARQVGGMIGPGVAESLRSRLRTFNEGVALLAERTVVP